MVSNKIVPYALVSLMLISLCAPTISADETIPEVQINTSWEANGAGELNHNYKITFGDDKAYTATFSLNHNRAGSQLDVDLLQTWDLEQGNRVVTLNSNTSLAWGDEISILVEITEYDGVEINPPVQHNRNFIVGTWNQPMDDHEIMLNTTWNLDQTYENQFGNQTFFLDFEGQGWQKREQNIVNSWELGNGSARFIEATEESVSNLSLNLASIWKNETIESGQLVSQVFDAQGDGTLAVISSDDDLTTDIDVVVSSAWLNRSIENDIVSERLKLEATGNLNISSQKTNDSSTTIDGDIALFYLETWDEDGIRRLSDQRIEATAEMIVIDEESRLDINLQEFESSARWEDGIRVFHIEELVGSGTFGFAESENESSVVVNGTIYDFHTLIEAGTTMIDDVHIDGTISGDVQGDFGILRGIEETGNHANATGVMFPVNVIHEQSWFNLTGVNGGNFFDGAGVGATHNKTWDYQVIYSDWDNRTIRLIWEETGPDASSGDEYPERSPIEVQPEPPQVEEALGNLTVARETGLMPIPMMVGDSLDLIQQEGLTLSITANSLGNDPRDGHNFHVVYWEGTYDLDTYGEAFGAIIDEGPLKGLLSSVSRMIEIPFGEEENIANFTETQVLTRVLSPSVVTSEQNNPPVIGEVYLKQGLIQSEGGSYATLIAEVSDADWNLESVFVDLTPIGGSITEMNDRGLSGDEAIGDDKYTTTIVIPGLEVGDILLNVSATDSFSVTTLGGGEISVINQAPRLTMGEVVPNKAPRGSQMVINVRAYDGHGVESVSLDFRDYGGEVVPMNESSGIWTLMIEIPEQMPPGSQSLKFIAIDSLGAINTGSVYYDYQQSSTHPNGPHYISDESPIPIVIDVQNSAPTITIPDEIVFTKSDELETRLLEIEITDYDGISNARASLGVFNMLGASEGWVTMNDNGINGDRVANDGIFTVELSLRSTVPTGTHEVLVQAADNFDVPTSPTPVIITVEDSSEVLPGVSSETLSTSVLVVILVLFSIVAIIAVISLSRRGNQGDKNNDRFGFE